MTRLHYLLLGVLFFIVGCSDTDIDEIAVVTEDIVYLSAEQVVLTGRILAQGSINGSTHGFRIADNEQLNGAVNLDLGQREIPGRFVGDFSDLVADTRYWYVSYVEVNGEVLTSTPQQFSTLRPSLTSFSPSIAGVGENVVITGSNFTNDTQVFFGGRQANIVEIKGESIITVQVPPGFQNPFEVISVISQGIEVVFEESFEYVIGLWEQVATFDPADFSVRESFSMGNEDFAVFGLGDRLFSMVFNNTVRLYDKQADQWSELPYDGPDKIDAFGAWPFFGGGTTNRTGFRNMETSVYKYENGEIIRQPDLIQGLYNCLAFSFDDALYLFGGFSEDFGNRSGFKFDVATETWSQIPGLIFQAEDDYYPFMYKGDAYYLGEFSNISKFDREREAWFVEAPSDIILGRGGVAVVVGDKAYMGLATGRRDIWELDLNDYSWKRKNAFTGSFRGENVVSWEFEGEVYILRSNPFAGRDPMEIWKFNPDQF